MNIPTKVDLYLTLDEIARISQMLNHAGDQGFQSHSFEQRRWDALYYDLRNAREAYQAAIYDAQRKFQEASCR